MTAAAVSSHQLMNTLGVGHCQCGEVIQGASPDEISERHGDHRRYLAQPSLPFAMPAAVPASGPCDCCQKRRASVRSGCLELCSTCAVDLAVAP